MKISEIMKLFILFFYNTKLMLVLLILSTFLVFLPASFSRFLATYELQMKFRAYFSILFMYSLSVVLVKIGYHLNKAIEKNQIRKYQIEYLRSKLNLKQKQLVLHIYNNEDRCLNLAFNDSNTAILEHLKIISRASKLSVNDVFFSYFLNPFVLSYLDNHKELVDKFTTDLAKKEVK